VQGGSVVKPLVGAANDGPSDAAVVRPVLGSHRGVAIACGINPRYGDLDPYAMAASAIDEAIRNCVAVGADPDRIAILDNFCWGNTDRPEELGKLVRAALACRDVATAYGTPFISGKDSLNNEFKLPSAQGSDRIVIPHTLLISAIGYVHDVRKCVTMDFKSPGNHLYLIGSTANELGGSHWSLVTGVANQQIPAVNPERGRKSFRFVHRAIEEGMACSCHDLSEGGLAVALAEMAFAGGFGAQVQLYEPGRDSFFDRNQEPASRDAILSEATWLLFSESNSRFVVEVPPERDKEFMRLTEKWGDGEWVEWEHLGFVTEEPTLEISHMPPIECSGEDTVLVRETLATLKECWQRPLRW